MKIFSILSVLLIVILFTACVHTKKTEPVSVDNTLPTGKGSLCFKVYENGGKLRPIVASTIWIYGKSDTTGVSDFDGNCMMVLSPGVYTVVVSSIGYYPTRIKNVAVISGRRKSISIPSDVTAYGFPVRKKDH